MTRAFTPPETLSKEDIRTIADVRRDIWTESFRGMAIGALSGIALHSIGRYGQKRGMLKGVTLSRNTAMLFCLGGGALGSFLMATVTGKNEVHNLHPIFQVGANKQQLIEDHDQERAELQRNRLLRQKTLQRQLTESHGLSDAHGGHWVDEKK